ncbi:MAG: ankyrin repeat domain-containing protein [Steroidobacteraceae bacterium]
MRYLALICSMLVAGAAQADPGLADLAQAGQDAAALKMIGTGANVNAPQGDGTTALDWATYRLDVPLAKTLLKHGANPNLANNLGSFPLSEAVRAANVELVKMLLKAGANADLTNADGQTSLMLAAHVDAMDIAKLLVRHGANVNARERWHGQTALMWAAAQGYPDMTEYLVRHGAKVNVHEDYNDWLDKATQITSEPRAQYRAEGGLTPLLYAARSGCMSCVQTIVGHGANVNEPTPEGFTPLITALDNRHYDVAQYLLQHGANPGTWDWYGRTPLYVAVDMHTYDDFGRSGPSNTPASAGVKKPVVEITAIDIIRMLLDAGVDPNVQLDLHRPSRGGNSGRFEDDLLRTGATPLLRAAMSHDNEVIELLLQHGALVDLPNVNGVTPLIVAAGMGFSGPSMTPVPDHRGDYAPGCQERAIGTIALLLKAGANINARVTDTSSYTARIARSSSMTHRQGETALYGAIHWGWPKVIAYLLQHGANPNLADDLGRTPLMAATHGVGIRGFKPDKEVIALLTQASAGTPQARAGRPSLTSSVTAAR